MKIQLWRLPDMNRIKRLAGLCVYVIAVSLMFMFTAGIHVANSADCTVLIRKFAEPEDGTLFRFNYEEDGVPGIADLSSGTGFNMFFTGSGFVEEVPPPGWVVDDIVCSEIEGIIFTIVRNGVEIECEDFMGTVETNCTFFNVPGSSAASVPTLSEWGMIAAAAGLGLVGVFFAVRRRKALTT